MLKINREPQCETYRELFVVPAAGTAALQAFPDVVIALSEIIPPH